MMVVVLVVLVAWKLQDAQCQSVCPSLSSSPPC
jgi:hypothetical protein